MHRIRIVDRGAEFGGVHIQSISLLGVIGSFHIVPGSVRSRNSCLLKVLSIIASSAVEPARRFAISASLSGARPRPSRNRRRHPRLAPAREIPEPCASLAAGINELSRESRSEEHTSELQSRLHLVCRLLLEKKKHASPTSLPNRFVSSYLTSTSFTDPD